MSQCGELEWGELPIEHPQPEEAKETSVISERQSKSKRRPFTLSDLSINSMTKTKLQMKVITKGITRSFKV